VLGSSIGDHDIDQEEDLTLLFTVLEERGWSISAFPVLLTPEGALSGFDAIREFLDSEVPTTHRSTEEA
jgi:hypothetical protein